MELFLQGLALGAVAGFFAGMLGIGGSTLLTPLLRTLLGLPPLVALGTPLPVVIPTAASSALAYYRHGFLAGRTAIYSAIAGVPATIFGALATAWLSGRFLMLATAVAIGLIGLDMLFGFSSRGGPPPGEEGPAEGPFGLSASIGAVAGFFAGLLAVGGGFILVPAYYRLLHFEIKRAIATSFGALLLLALPGTIVHSLLGHVDWLLTLALSASSIPMAFLGAHVAIYLRSGVLEKIFASALVVSAALFFYSQL